MLKIFPLSHFASASCIALQICVVSGSLWGQGLYSHALVKHLGSSDGNCDSVSDNTTPAVCKASWHTKDYTASGSGVSSATSDYGFLRIGASAGCASSNNPPTCQMDAEATAQFVDYLTFENLPAGQSYVNITVSVGVYTPQGKSEVGVSEEARFGATQCNIVSALTGACSVVAAISNDGSPTIFVVDIQGQAQVTSAGSAGFLAGFGKTPSPTGGNVVSVSIQDSNGKPIKGAVVVSSSGHKYPSKFETTTTLISKPNPSTLGQTVIFTATPASPWALPPGTVPTGTVTFNDGTTIIGTATLQAGIAEFVTSSLSSGTHQITAMYKGDPYFAHSTSPVLSQTVQ